MISDNVMDENKNEPNEELLQIPLRGILRSQGDYIIDDKIIANRLVVVSLILLIIFIIIPIIVVCAITLWGY